MCYLMTKYIIGRLMPWGGYVWPTMLEDCFSYFAKTILRFHSQLQFSMSDHLLIYKLIVPQDAATTLNAPAVTRYSNVVRPSDPQNKYINIYLTDYRSVKQRYLGFHQ